MTEENERPDRLLTANEVCSMLSIRHNALYEYIKEGKLKAHKLGGNGNSRRPWRIWWKDLQAFVKGDYPNA
ncbi:unnamed protein product [marine sediment metagenome]|uniref:Helix-turn-helix domain-containing protein n=1 Tax=marine sediment metagenome TaxID=412755 RepID=X0T7F0_9ZZZZ